MSVKMSDSEDKRQGKALLSSSIATTITWLGMSCVSLIRAHYQIQDKKKTFLINACIG